MTRFGYVMTTYFVALGMGISSLFHPSPRLLWNVSASLPTGFYTLEALQPLRDGELVAARPPGGLSAFMDARHYLPIGVPLLKYIGALPGQIVCRYGRTITIDGKTVASAMARDHTGLRLPVWTGCRALKSNEVFLLNPTVQDSFDGRYFGSLPMASLIGRAAPLWTNEAR
jgi:conjugative transfer signal peptidase TraF